MKLPKINKILFVFMLSVAMVVTGVFKFVESEKFSELLSSRITKHLQKKLNAKISFSKVEIGIFPLSTILKNGRISWHKDKVNIQFNADEMGIYFGVIDALLNKLTVDRVKLENGEITTTGIFENNKRKKKISSTKDIFEIYRDLKSNLKMIKVKNFELRDIMYHDEYNSMVFDHLEMGIYENVFIGKGLIIPRELKKLKRTSIPDSIELDVQLTKDKIRVKKFQLKEKFTVISYYGDVEAENERPMLKGQIELTGNLKRVLNFTEIKPLRGDEIEKGFLRAEVNIDTISPSPVIDAKVNFKNVYSDYFIVDDFYSNITLQKGKVKIASAELYRKRGKIKLKMPVDVYDYDKKKALLKDIYLTMDNVHSNDLLFALRKILQDLKGHFSGDGKISFKEDSIQFTGGENFSFKDFELYSNTNKILLKNDGFTFPGTHFKVSKDLSLFSIDGKIVGRNIKGDVNAIFESRGLNVNVDFEKFDFFEFGPIVSTPIHGIGPAILSIRGPYRDTIIELESDFTKFSVIDVFVDSLKCHSVFRLKEVELSLLKCEGAVGKGAFRGSGIVSFLDNGALDLFFKYRDIRYRSMLSMLPKVFPEKNFGVKSLFFKNSGKVKVQGGFTTNSLDIVGKNTATDFLYKNEVMDKIKGDFSLRKNKLRFKNIQGKKSTGILFAKGVIDLNKKEFEYDAKINNLRLIDLQIYKLLNLGLEGKVKGESYGSGSFEDFSLKTHFKFYDGHISGIRAPDSLLTFHANESELYGSGNLFDGVASFKTFIGLGKKVRDKKSYFKANIDTDNLKLVAGLFSKHNVVRDDFRANIKGDIDLNFNIDQLTDFDLNMNLDKFFLFLDGEDFRVDRRKNSIKIVRGKIKKWDVLINGSLGVWESTGSGEFYNKFKVFQKMDINPYVLTLLSNKIIGVKGNLRGNHIFVGNRNEFKNFLEMEGHDFSFRGRSIPGSFSKVKFKLLSDNRKIILSDLYGEFGGGPFSADGVMLLKIPFPEINVNFKFDKSRLSLFKKSNIIVTGKGKLEGLKPPYDLDGEVEILRGDILDEFAEMAKGTISFDEYDQFIPKTEKNDALTYIKNNLTLKVQRPMSIKNSFSDLKIFGRANILGRLSNPLIRGEFQIIPHLSKFYFKGHDFLLSEGIINFTDDKIKMPPQVSFVGQCKINKYEVKLRVSGNVKNVNIAMNSDPPLSRNDIFSLLTLGVTSDISKDLAEKDRQSITTLGIGSLIVDQLRISEGIGTNLGLRLSVQPEFIQDDSSLLDSRSGAESISSRYKTATKIKLQKRVSKKVNVSVSSLVGSDNDQKQEMNINYNLNRNFSVEGVYEINNSDEEEGSGVNSFGLDLKFRKSFD